MAAQDVELSPNRLSTYHAAITCSLFLHPAFLLFAVEVPRSEKLVYVSGGGDADPSRNRHTPSHLRYYPLQPENHGVYKQPRRRVENSRYVEVKAYY